jgi:hypothetical protein
MRVLVFTVLFLCIGASQATAREHTFRHEDQQLVVDLHFLLPASRRQDVLAWIQTGADALASVYGRWPRSNLRIEVAPIGLYTSDSIPWAQVTRGDPDTVAFYIDAMASEQDLVRNWTTYHELSHLLIPYRGWGELWFSEGLASYYQNLLQARAGLIDEREMWQKLYDGFERGRDNRRPDLTLAELSPMMRENRSFMRVYWSGAWYFLNADVELRKMSDGSVTLDSALGMLNVCCRDRSMSAREIVSELDVLTQSKVFSALFQEVSSSLALPATSALFADLGIVVEVDVVGMSSDYPGSSIRQSIGGFQE